MSILTTKIRVPPLRPTLVARERLHALLERGLGLPLTLVVAPAGFGKTTLVSSWCSRLAFSIDQRDGRTLNRSGHSSLPTPLYFVKVAWLSLDPADNDPIRFWHYLLEACDRASPGLARPALALLQGPPPPPEALATALLNALADRADPLVLVLDDYHLIETPAIHTSVALLLEHQAAALRLVLTSRSLPPLPLARLRARGQLLEVNAEALRFALDEATHFFAETMGTPLRAELVAAVAQRTEGWAAGLQLAALSLRDHPNAEAFITALRGSHHLIADYLLDEVLARQSAPVQCFLLLTAVLTRLSGPLCDALMRAEGSGLRAEVAESQPSDLNPEPASRLLEQLERNNLFLTHLDEEKRWFRYHALFAEALQSRLRQIRPDLPPLLHAHAARWWLACEGWAEAVHHAEASGDQTLLAEVLDAAGGPLLMSGQAGQLWQWLSRVPDSMTRSCPTLALFAGWAALLCGQIPLVEPLLAQAEAAAAGVAPAELPAWRGQIAAIRSYRQVVQGDVAGALAAAQPAIKALPAYDPLMRAVVGMNLGAVYAVAGQIAPALHLLGDADASARAIGNPWVARAAQELRGQIWLEQGDLTRAAATFQSLLADDESSPTQRLSATLSLAAISYELNTLPQARHYSDQGHALAVQLGLHEWTALHLLTLARVAWATRDTDHASSLLSEAEEQIRSSSPLRAIIAAMLRHTALKMAYTAPAAGGPASALPPIAPQDLGILQGSAGFQSLQQKARYLAAAMELLRVGRSAEAAALLHELLAIAEAAGRGASAIEVLVLRSLAETAQGRHDAAGATLRLAVDRAAAAGYLRSFLDFGEPMRALLARHAADLPYAQVLLDAFPPAVQPDASGTPDLVEPLKAREIDVLRLVAAGHSNSAIAEELIIAVGTVKKHLNNIFGKLGVGSRTQAVARARDLNLLNAVRRSNQPPATPFDS